MISDEKLEWVKKLLVKWSLMKENSLKFYIKQLPLSNIQREIIALYFIQNNHKTCNFKEIEFKLNKSHDYVMKQYKKSLHIILDYLPTFIFLNFPED